MVTEDSEDIKPLITQESHSRDKPAVMHMRTSNPNFSTARSLMLKKELSQTSNSKRDMYLQGLMKTYNASPLNSGPISMESVQNLHTGNPASKQRLS